MSPTPNTNDRRAGFTLLEVLVALAVVALSLTAMIKSSGDATSNIAYLQEKTRAHWIAMDRISELRVAREWPSTGTERDEVEMYGVDWTWIQEVSETTVEDMRRVDVSVFLTEYGDEDYPLATMTGFLINPRFLQERQ